MEIDHNIVDWRIKENTYEFFKSYCMLNGWQERRQYLTLALFLSELNRFAELYYYFSKNCEKQSDLSYDEVTDMFSLLGGFAVPNNFSPEDMIELMCGFVEESGAQENLDLFLMKAGDWDISLLGDVSIKTINNVPVKT